MSTHQLKVRHCVLMPTYNNAEKIEPVLQKLIELGHDVIVINDGATDGTTNILANYPDLTIINHDGNQGKGVALRNGFAKAIDLGYDYAVTIDSDGQHDPDDMAGMFDLINEHPGCMVMGSRNMEQEGVPTKSSFGNKFSNFWFMVETGIKLPDTQTGFRAYPLAPMKGKKWFTKKFEFEIEVIVRLAWSNVKFFPHPISVLYEDDRITHFRPFKDFTRISILNTVLVTLALLFYLPRLIVWNFSLKETWGRLKVEFKKNSDEPAKLAFAVGLGFFFGVFPVWGFQMLIAFAIASYFGLNRFVVLFCSNISIPPMVPLIIFFSFLCGVPFVSEPVQFSDFTNLTLESIYQQLIQYLVGSTVLSLGLGLVTGLVAYVIARFFKSRGAI
ncbi:MAG: DUF2062 domain-containing protein [Reichenbachiella sp.]